MGNKDSDPNAAESISEKEQDLLTAFREGDERQRDLILRFARQLTAA